MSWTPHDLEIASGRLYAIRGERGGTLPPAVQGGAKPVGGREKHPLQLFDGYVGQIAGLYLVRHDR